MGMISESEKTAEIDPRKRVDILFVRVDP